MQIHGRLERSSKLEAEAFDRDALGRAFQLPRELVGDERLILLLRSLARGSSLRLLLLRLRGNLQAPLHLLHGTHLDVQLLGEDFCWPITCKEFQQDRLLLVVFFLLPPALLKVTDIRGCRVASCSIIFAKHGFQQLSYKGGGLLCTPEIEEYVREEVASAFAFGMEEEEAWEVEVFFAVGVWSLFCRFHVLLTGRLPLQVRLLME